MYSPTYVIDTCSVIKGHADEDARSVLEYLIKSDRLKTPPAVLWELEVGDDDAYAWAIRWQHPMVKELNEKSGLYLRYLMKHYERPFKDCNNAGKTHRGLIKKGTQYEADPEVIALAREHGWVVITEELSGIKGACVCEGIECITLESMIQSEEPYTEKQLNFMNMVQENTAT